jgi:penicillin-binding protein 2
VAIGQGAVSVTPISLAVMMATVANGGTRVTPHLLKAVNDGDGWSQAAPPVPRSAVALSPRTLSAVTDGLWYVVNRAGTGRRGRINGRDVIGKTGTAQVISLQGRIAAGDSERDLRDHGWFVFAAPAGAPEIAGVVFGEHAEHGYLAAPIARHVMETYFAKQEGRPRPVLPLPARPPAVPAIVAATQ